MDYHFHPRWPQFLSKVSNSSGLGKNRGVPSFTFESSKTYSIWSSYTISTPLLHITSDSGVRRLWLKFLWPSVLKDGGWFLSSPCWTDSLSWVSLPVDPQDENLFVPGTCVPKNSRKITEWELILFCRFLVICKLFLGSLRHISGFISLSFFPSQRVSLLRLTRFSLTRYCYFGIPIYRSPSWHKYFVLVFRLFFPL